VLSVTAQRAASRRLQPPPAHQQHTPRSTRGLLVRGGAVPIWAKPLPRPLNPACASRRYAGRAYEKEADLGGPGTLMVKGLKSMWRQAAPVVRRTLHGCLQRILMQACPPGAAVAAQGAAGVPARWLPWPEPH